MSNPVFFLLVVVRMAQVDGSDQAVAAFASSASAVATVETLIREVANSRTRERNRGSCTAQ